MDLSPDEGDGGDGGGIDIETKVEQKENVTVHNPAALAQLLCRADGTPMESVGVDEVQKSAVEDGIVHVSNPELLAFLIRKSKPDNEPLPLPEAPNQSSDKVSLPCTSSSSSSSLLASRLKASQALDKNYQQHLQTALSPTNNDVSTEKSNLSRKASRHLLPVESDEEQ